MRQALELALEALQFALHIGFPESSESQIKKGEKAYQQHRAAITAIKEALAQPERDYERGFIDGMQKQMQSSVDKVVNAMSRTWVGLTDEEQQQAYEQWQNDGWGVFYNAIEAKLKEKNT
jgi:hypothetical protein